VISSGALAAAYALAMIVAGGLKFVLLAALLYAPGTVLFRMARRQQGAPVFASTLEWAVFGATAVAAAGALYGLVTGALTV
jgi:arginine:ornithine antiporter/lysine permease